MTGGTLIRGVISHRADEWKERIISRKETRILTLSDSAVSLWTENTIRFSKTEVMANFEKIWLKLKMIYPKAITC